MKCDLCGDVRDDCRTIGDMKLVVCPDCIDYTVESVGCPKEGDEDDIHMS